MCCFCNTSFYVGEIKHYITTENNIEVFCCSLCLPINTMYYYSVYHGLKDTNGNEIVINLENSNIITEVF